MKSFTLFEILCWISHFFFRNFNFFFQSFDQRFNLNTAEKSSKKRKFVDVEKNSFKKSKFNSQNADKIKQNKKINNQTTSFYIHNDSFFDNRIFDCLMISSVNRAIWNFRSILKLLKTLRDTIKTHKSLYAKKKTLHRNISKNNIIITTPRNGPGRVESNAKNSRPNWDGSWMKAFSFHSNRMIVDPDIISNKWKQVSTPFYSFGSIWEFLRNPNAMT